MADVRPFRGLRYDTGAVDPSRTIAPPYDVISDALQRELYGRSPHNIVRVEYARDDAEEGGDKYARARSDLASWVAADVLVRDETPSLYAYRQEFDWDGQSYARTAWFGAVRLEPWDAGVIKPHEYTLAKPKEDRLRLLRATRTQVSPVYGLFRGGVDVPQMHGETVVQAEADGQRHTLERVTDAGAIAAFARVIAGAQVYIADGHHRYETALAYRDEAKSRAASWTGEEPENFVLMALTRADDPGLLVLPIHRLVNPPSRPADAVEAMRACFDVTAVAGDAEALEAELSRAGRDGTAFVALGLGERPLLLTLRDPEPIYTRMPAGQPESWMRLDVNILQYGVLLDVFGIDDEALRAGGAVSYTQDAREAVAAVASGAAQVAFLLNATPVSQVLAVADAGGRMPQKSTFFHPKLPTGLVLRPLD